MVFASVHWRVFTLGLGLGLSLVAAGAAQGAGTGRPVLRRELLVSNGYPWHGPEERGAATGAVHRLARHPRTSMSNDELAALLTNRHLAALDRTAAGKLLPQLLTQLADLQASSFGPNLDFWPKVVAKQAARKRWNRSEWMELAYALEVLDTLRSNGIRMQFGQDFQLTRAFVPLRAHGAIVGQADALGTQENGRPVAFAVRLTSLPHMTRRTQRFSGVRGARRELAATPDDVRRFIVTDGPLPPSLRGHAMIWYPEGSDGSSTHGAESRLAGTVARFTHLILPPSPVVQSLLSASP